MLIQIVWIFVSASGMLSVSIALNALSTHATCTNVFMVVAAIIAFAFASIQTLGKITWLAWIGIAGIITASKSTNPHCVDKLTRASHYSYSRCWR